MQAPFDDIITSEHEIREILGEPVHRAAVKVIDRLDEHCRSFIAKSPFLLIASHDGEGNMDVSPKGDPPGFVQVLDDHTLAIPDRLGNARADTFLNVLKHPSVALLFLIPGNKETLRVAGTARIVRDAGLRERFAMNGKVPNLVTVVSVKEAFVHCPKCVIRSKLWDADDRDLDGVPTLARMLIDHGKLPDREEDLQAAIDQSVKDRLY